LFIEFKEFDIDCEYDRHIDHQKRVENLDSNIRPDIVIHKRGKDDNNLVYIEVKKEQNKTSRNKDFKKIIEISETVAVQTTFSDIKHIYIPESLSEGKYFVEVEVLYDGKEAIASSNFYVKSVSKYEKNLVVYLLMGLFVVFTIFTIVFYHFTQKMIRMEEIKK